MDTLTVAGTPRDVDRMLRPVLRPIQLVVGGLGTIVLLWLEAWWWVPLPLAASFLILEWVIATRRDRPVQLVLESRGARLRDPLHPAHGVDVPVDEVDAVDILRRPSDDGAAEALLVLSSRGDVLLAIPVRTRAEPSPDEVVLDRADPLLTGVGHLGRSVAPVDRLCRQTIDDDRVLAWARATFPPEVRARTGLRVWQGAAPSLDLFGYHDTAPDGWLRLDGEDLALGPHPLAPDRDRVRPRAFRCVGASLGRSTRSATLLSAESGATRIVDELPMLVITIVGADAPVRIAMPAPAAPEDLPAVALDEDTLHVHAAQGASLLAHLSRTGALRRAG